MRVLVTGSQGCIGAWVVKQLVERRLDVLLYDLDPTLTRLSMIAPQETLRGIKVETGRIEDTDHVKRLVRDEQITHIVHLAAVLMPFCQQNPVQGGMINVIGTLNVFEAARDAGRPVRVVYASSSAVWGPGELYGGRAVNESDPVKPATHYGVFKHANEENARVFYHANGISSIGLRPWTVYGPGRDTGLTADPTLAMRAVAQRSPYRIRLSGHLDLLFTLDMAEAFVQCLLSPLEGAHAFNIAGEIVSVPELIALLEELRPAAKGLIDFSGPEVPVTYQMDDSQLRSKISEIPRTTLAEGARQTIETFERLQTEGRLGAGV